MGRTEAGRGPRLDTPLDALSDGQHGFDIAALGRFAPAVRQMSRELVALVAEAAAP